MSVWPICSKKYKKLSNKALLVLLSFSKSSHTPSMLRFLELRVPKNSSCYTTSKVEGISDKLVGHPLISFQADNLLASDLLHTTDVTATLKLGVEECVNDSHSLVVRDETCRQHNHICIVVLACEGCNLGFPAQTCAD